MNNKGKESGWANPRARPFVGNRVFLTKLRQLTGARYGQYRAGKNQGAAGAFPPILQIQTKTGCNADCIFCPQRKIGGMFPDNVMSDALFHSIVTQCSGRSDLYGIGFTLQNEPLTDPGIFKKIRYFRDHVQTRAMTFLVTNGTLLTPLMADELLDSGLDALHISCNGFGKEQFESINKGKSWDTFMENIDHFISRDLSKTAVMISIVRSGLFPEEQDKTIEYWRSRGLQCYIHGINNRAGSVDNYELYARPMKKEKSFVKLRKKLVKTFLRCCPYPFLQMSVLANGESVICTHDWQRRQTIGDLSQKSISEIWNGPAMRDYRLLLLAGKTEKLSSCSKCDVYENASFA